MIPSSIFSPTVVSVVFRLILLSTILDTLNPPGNRYCAVDLALVVDKAAKLNLTLACLNLDIETLDIRIGEECGFHFVVMVVSSISVPTVVGRGSGASRFGPSFSSLFPQPARVRAPTSDIVRTSNLFWIFMLFFSQVELN